MSDFLYLVYRTVELSLVILPVSFFLATWLILGLLCSPHGPEQPTGGWLLQLVPLAVPLLILAVGATLHAPRNMIAPPAGYESWLSAIGWLMLLEVSLGIPLVVVARGSARLLGSALQASLLWLSYIAYIVSTMSITGNPL